MTRGKALQTPIRRRATLAFRRNPVRMSKANRWEGTAQKKKPKSETVYTAEKGVPQGNRWERGFHSHLVQRVFKAPWWSLTLNWSVELGQTCEAARNGTKILFQNER